LLGLAHHAFSTPGQVHTHAGSSRLARWSVAWPLGSIGGAIDFWKVDVDGTAQKVVLTSDSFQLSKRFVETIRRNGFYVSKVPVRYAT
jgi:hypothetical protein